MRLPEARGKLHRRAEAVVGAPKHDLGTLSDVEELVRCWCSS
jgi:hypothetical protein